MNEIILTFGILFSVTVETSKLTKKIDLKNNQKVQKNDTHLPTHMRENVTTTANRNLWTHRNIGEKERWRQSEQTVAKKNTFSCIIYYLQIYDILLVFEAAPLNPMAMDGQSMRFIASLFACKNKLTG